jgi:hypothetical protein
MPVCVKRGAACKLYEKKLTQANTVSGYKIGLYQLLSAEIFYLSK